MFYLYDILWYVLFVSKSSKYFFKDWSFGFSFFLCFFSYPCFLWHSLDFAFVFPLAYRLCFYYVTDPNKRWIAQKATLLICQFVYFHQVDLVLFLFFNINRKIQLWNVLLAFFKVSIPYVNQWIGKFCFHYVPGILFFLVLFWFYDPKRKLSLCFYVVCPLYKHMQIRFFMFTCSTLAKGIVR